MSTLSNHLKIARTPTGTKQGMDMLRVANLPENNYAANTYLTTLACVNDLVDYIKSIDPHLLTNTEVGDLLDKWGIK